MFRVATVKLINVWTTLPNRRVMRGCERHLLIKEFDKEEKLSNLGSARSDCGNKPKTIEDELCASRKPEE
jgi:hypothetical protein